MDDFLLYLANRKLQLEREMSLLKKNNQKTEAVEKALLELNQVINQLPEEHYVNIQSILKMKRALPEELETLFHEAEEFINAEPGNIKYRKRIT